MVNINNNASALQAQLQAQLQANKSSPRVAARAPEQTAPRPQDVIDDRIKARRDDQGAGRGAQQPQRRTSDVSSAEELEEASNRVSQFTGEGSREAPVGRTSQRQSELRAQPLGQIIDIRV